MTGRLNSAQPYALGLFRIVVGLLFACHGAASLFGVLGGTDGGGVSDATGLPLRWSETENVRWKTPIPGISNASPIVKIFRVVVGLPVIRCPIAIAKQVPRVPGVIFQYSMFRIVRLARGTALPARRWTKI